MGVVKRVVYSDLADVPLSVAQEVALVGVVPVRVRWPNGHTFELAGQRVTVIGECTKEEFRRAVLTSGLEGAAERFMCVPPELSLPPCGDGLGMTRYQKDDLIGFFLGLSLVAIFNWWLWRR